MDQTPTLLLDKARRFRTARVEQGRQVTDPPCIVLLGRLGDVINALPIAWHLSKLHGKPVPFIVAKQFADPVLAASYVKAEIWDGEFFSSLSAAVKSASERYGKVLVLQTNGQGYVFRKSTQSFCNEAYTLSGLDGKRGSLPLVFDQRNAEREAELVNRVCNSKPLVLYNFTGHSSPLPSKQDVVNAISKWSSIANLVDTATCGSKSIVDLLALYERAAALITVDTSTLHLAAASDIPYAAFIQDKEQWYGSIPMGNCKLAIPYSGALNSIDQLDCVLDDLIPRNLLGNMREPDLTISIACHNRLDVTKQCLESVYAHTSRFNLVVTDNASKDGTKEFLADFGRSKPNLKVVSNSENLGFQIPHNAAFSKSETPYFCVLNNDTMLAPGWWPKAKAAFKADPNLAIVGNDARVCLGIRSNFDGHPGHPSTAEYVEGSLLIVRADIPKRLGGLFSNYLKFAYGEDSDLSLRVREAGYHIKLLPLQSDHIGGQTVKSMTPEQAQRVIEFQRQNHETLMCRWNVYLRKRTFEYEVLIKRNGALGDVIAMTPVIAALHKKWPRSKIRVLTQFPDVFQGNPHVAESGSQIRVNPDFIYTLDLAYEKIPKVHIVEAYARTCQVECPIETARLEFYFDHKLKAPGIPVCAIHPGPTGWIGRDWPMARWLELIRRLKGYRFIQVGSNTKDLRIEQAPITNLQNLAGTISSCSLFIGLDSGPSWVAQAAGVPSVILFGTIDPKLRLLPAHGAVAVHADPSKVPCVGEHHRLPPPIVHSTCQGACMEAITVDMVLDGVKRASKTV